MATVRDNEFRKVFLDGITDDALASAANPADITTPGFIAGAATLTADRRLSEQSHEKSGPAADETHYGDIAARRRFMTNFEVHQSHRSTL